MNKKYFILNKITVIFFILILFSCTISINENDTNENHTNESENIIVTQNQSKTIDTQTLLSIVNSSPNSIEDIASNTKAIDIPIDMQNALINVWNSMNDSEKELILNSNENISLNLTKEIESTSNESENTSYYKTYAQYDNYLLTKEKVLEYLEINFGARFIDNPTLYYQSPSNELISKKIEANVPAYLVAFNYFSYKLFDQIEELSQSFSINLDINYLKSICYKYEQSINNENQINYYQKTPTFYTSPLVNGTEGLGQKLKNGDIVLVKIKNAANIMTYWSHVGMFDRDTWINSGKTDYIHSMISAQPEFNKDSLYPPVNPGYYSYDPLAYYNYSIRAMVIRPKNYTNTKSIDAIKKGRELVENKNKYNAMGDNCGRIVHQSWLAGGTNVDSNSSWFWFFVDPNDIYRSTKNRYITIKISLIFYTYYKRIKTYSATTDIIYDFKR